VNDSCGPDEEEAVLLPLQVSSNLDKKGFWLKLIFQAFVGKTFLGSWGSDMIRPWQKKDVSSWQLRTIQDLA
jgi:hypothetical protein